MTLDEVADYLRVSERTVSEWAARGEIPGGKLGTSWRFKRSEVEQWVNRKLTPRLKEIPDAMSGLSSVLKPDCVTLLRGGTKEEVLNELIDLCVAKSGKNIRDEMSQAIFEREKLMSTGIGFSIGLPHARLNSVASLKIVLGVSKSGINDYEALDDVPVKIILMIVAGRDQHVQYIKLLSQVSKILKDDRVKEELLHAETKEELYQTITGKDHI
jgi:PTS system nitrogen regulatory IIA component